MISNITQSPPRTYSRLPKSWEARANLINYDQADASIHYEDGWRDYVQPTFDPSTHRLGELFYDRDQDIVTREVIAKTPEELEAERKAQVPFSITPAQGRIQLAAAGLLEAVLAALPTDPTDPLYIYWEYALTWELESPYVKAMAATLGLTDEQLDDFFIAASKIK